MWAFNLGNIICRFVVYSIEVYVISSESNKSLVASNKVQGDTNIGCFQKIELGVRILLCCDGPH